MAPYYCNALGPKRRHPFPEEDRRHYCGLPKGHKGNHKCICGRRFPKGKRSPREGE